jgi:hypothetical protein
MRFKRKKKINNIYILIIIIFMYCSSILNYIENRVDEVSTKSIQLLVKKDIYRVIYNNISDMFENKNVDDFIDIVKSNDGSIISVDYKVSECYKVLNNYVNSIYNSLINTDFSDNYYQDGVYFVSSSLLNNAVIFNNLGIKIPVKVNVANDVRINFKTKVKDYGINSVLVELYLVLDVQSWFINPFNEGGFGESYEYVVASRIVNGDIPSYYGGMLEKSSSVVSS